MTSRNAPLPALHHTAPSYNGLTQRRRGKNKKSAFSLDGYLSSTEPQLPLPNPASTSFSLPLQNPIVTSNASRRAAVSPAEKLLAGDAAPAPLSSRPNSPLVPPPGAELPPPLPSAAARAATFYNSAMWRSQLLQCEAQLRELVAQGVHEPPSMDRITQVMSLFDEVTSEVEAHQGNSFLGSLLRLFRVEFCRAIFLDGSDPSEGGASLSVAEAAAGAAAAASARAMKGCGGSGGARLLDEDGLPQTYFDEAASLQRTKAALTSALANGASGETLLLLERELEDKREQVTWYEGELNRVRTQYEKVAEECLGLRQTAEAQQREAAAVQKRLQQDVQSLHVENKDLQIQLFRLRKQLTGGMAALLKDSYRQLKLSKLGLTQRLFNEGDERVALLVLLGQVESRVNEILDSYDNDFVLASESGRQKLQLKMAQTVTVLLEDMHYCEASYRRLVGAHQVKIADQDRNNGDAASEQGEEGDRESGRTAATPLQRIPVSVVHSGKDEEAPDESDGYVAILFDPKIYEEFQSRHAVRARLLQYKKDRDEESAKASRKRALDEHTGFVFPTTDSTFLTSDRTAASTAAAADNNVVTQRETLSTLLSGMFGVDPKASKSKTDPPFNSSSASESAVNDAAMPLAAADASAAAATAAAAPSQDERLKKWSLDSSVVLNGGSLSARAAPQFGQGAGVTQSKQERSPSPAGPNKRDGGGTSLATAVPATSAGSSQAQQGRTTLSLDTAAAPQASLEDVVERQKAEWVAHILGPSSTSVAFTVPGRHPEKGDVVVVHEKAAEVVPAELMMRRVLHHPMEDLCNERFLSTVEVFTGENPTQQRLLCRVNHVDPSVPIRVPETTNFVRVKYALAENAVPPGTTTRSVNTATGAAAAAAGEAGANTTSAAPTLEDVPPGTPVFRGNPQLRLFKELNNKTLVEGNLGLQYCAGAVNSTTASTVAFQRLHPMSPNRGPEWLLYQQLFGAYRSLNPRMMEVTTIDHMMACASERYFTRMEYRYDECYLRAAGQCSNHQLRHDVAERLFKDQHTLSDFQEALVDELEARYGYPELVAKTLYEMLCYLNAMAEKDTVLAAYLDAIRGFAPPTEIHFMSYMLYHLSYCWPESSPSSAVPVEDVRTVLEYVYRNASSIMPIKPDAILKDYDVATRSAPLNFVNFRQFIASTMAHQEESILLHLYGLFHTYTQHAVVDGAGWDMYTAVIGKVWRQKDERRNLVRYLTSCLGVNRSTSPTLPQLTLLAASAWSSNLWE